MVESKLEEYNRIESIRSDSEKIWEERTYQIAAGGLSLTFAIYSYLGSKYGLKFDWMIGVIWSLYALCIVLNYISHLITAMHCSKIQNALTSEVVDEHYIDTLYNRANSFRWFNYVVVILLIVDIVLTIVYSSILLSEL